MSDDKLTRRELLERAALLGAAAAVPGAGNDDVQGYDDGAAVLERPSVGPAQPTAPTPFVHPVECFHEKYRAETNRPEAEAAWLRLRETMTDEQLDWLNEYESESGACWVEEQDRFVDELCRHMPDLAPRIRAVAWHARNEHRDEWGVCCTPSPEVEDVSIEKTMSWLDDQVRTHSRQMDTVRGRLTGQLTREQLDDALSLALNTAWVSVAEDRRFFYTAPQHWERRLQVRLEPIQRFEPMPSDMDFMATIHRAEGAYYRQDDPLRREAFSLSLYSLDAQLAGWKEAISSGQLVPSDSARDAYIWGWGAAFEWLIRQRSGPEPAPAA